MRIQRLRAEIIRRNMKRRTYPKDRICGDDGASIGGGVVIVGYGRVVGEF